MYKVSLVFSANPKSHKNNFDNCNEIDNKFDMSCP